MMQCRIAYRYAPALSPVARELRIEIPQVRWVRHGTPAGSAEVLEEIHGPWPRPSSHSQASD
jgi:hypothetical protein